MRITRLLRIVVVFGCILLVLPSAAGAGFWSDVKDSSKKAWKDIKNTGKKVPGEVADDAKEAWSDVKETGKKSGKTVVRETKSVPDNTRKGVKEVKESD